MLQDVLHRRANAGQRIPDLMGNSCRDRSQGEKPARLGAKAADPFPFAGIAQHPDAVGSFSMRSASGGVVGLQKANVSIFRGDQGRSAGTLLRLLQQGIQRTAVIAEQSAFGVLAAQNLLAAPPDRFLARPPERGFRRGGELDEVFLGIEDDDGVAIRLQKSVKDTGVKVPLEKRIRLSGKISPSSSSPRRSHSSSAIRCEIDLLSHVSEEGP